MPTLYVKPQTPLEMWLDQKTEWLMRHLSGTSVEGLQVTHRWNNHHLKEGDVSHLNRDWMASHPGDPEAQRIPKFPLAHAIAHATKYGGWSRYLVVDAIVSVEEGWHVGWKWQGGQGVSRIVMKGPRRVLLGPEPASWFGIAVLNNSQIPIRIIGEGIIGDGGKYSHLPIF